MVMQQLNLKKSIFSLFLFKEKYEKDKEWVVTLTKHLLFVRHLVFTHIS